MSLDFTDLSSFHAAEIGQALESMDPWKHLNFDADSLIRYLLKPDAALIRTVMIHNGRLVGALAVRSPWLRGPYLELLAVLPHEQGRSFGKQALDWAFANAKTSGATNFWACVSAFNAKARGFYAHM